MPPAAFPGHQKGMFPATIWLLHKQASQARLTAAVDGSKVMQHCGTGGKQSKMDPSPGCEAPTATRFQGMAVKSPSFLPGHRAQPRYQTKTSPWILGTSAKGSGIPLGYFWDTFGIPLDALCLPSPCPWAGYPTLQLSWGRDAAVPAQCHSRLGGHWCPGSTTDTVTAL